MTELIRQIEEKDIPLVKEILYKVFSDDNYNDILRLGGMTNHSYKVTRNDGEEYVVRIPGEGTEELINRFDERKSTELACRLGIDSELLYFGDDGAKVMRFICDPQPISEGIMQKKENLVQAAAIFRKLHTCGIDTGVRFEVFEMVDLYERLIRKENVAVYDDYEDVKDTVYTIKKAVDATGIAPKVPCHNDSLIGNWVIDKSGNLYLIDWEYSGMNEAMWDLACLSIEAGYTEANDRELMDAYYKRNATSDEKKRFIASKLYVDYLWTLWGLVRIPFDGSFMQEYADQRYERLKRNMLVYKNL